MKGTDYFKYHSCDIIAVRNHVLGDIYHSQLVEVGVPDASLDFIGENQEAYFRFRNNYANFINKNASRKSVLYAGSNSGMLHAIYADEIDALTRGGKEEWAFIPPPVIGMLPKIIKIIDVIP